LHRLTLQGSSGSICLVDYEDAPHGLDRLFRLHKGYSHTASSLRSAILLYNGLPLSRREREAVQWAADREPLQALALGELVAAVEDLLP